MLVKSSLVPLLLSATALALPTHQNPDYEFDDCDQDWEGEGAGAVQPSQAFGAQSQPSGQAFGGQSFGAKPSGNAFGAQPSGQPFGAQPSGQPSGQPSSVQVQPFAVPSSAAPFNVQPSSAAIQVQPTSEPVSVQTATPVAEPSTTSSSSSTSSSFTAAAATPTTVSTTQHEASTTTSSNTQASTDLCGDYDYIILQDTPWIVYNMLYNADEIVGSQCTNYGEVITSNGTQEVVWSSVTEIEYVESTNNVPKGYSFVGLTENLETKLSAIDSIPTEYVWSRTNTTAFKGNMVFDFMTNDVKGDSTSTSSQELMLWLEYEGGQLPIGWTNGVVDTIDDLFGTSWSLYQDKNSDTGITVSSLLPTTQFQGSFSGDLKDWLLALVKVGVFDEDTYVNVGNAGTEFMYGNAVMNSTLGLQINLS
ncbi:concanavalin A-like lectin/glucanase [Aspergillus ellipticus CBS 707.79]|uniref:xyloglucan-specific endo-beta-1,4-glucanase n=1 Tax=Aspergillus ellipticus CBS 707.79 TaxID=1448320 RepID=A0A319D1Y1_9EURO|nr:concanavalin A-like lectin/glucanase [Aspergillus ellipticus CBS 707.79]